MSIKYDTILANLANVSSRLNKKADAADQKQTARRTKSIPKFGASTSQRTFATLAPGRALVGTTSSHTSMRPRLAGIIGRTGFSALHLLRKVSR